jgi:hypothetical protein
VGESVLRFDEPATADANSQPASARTASAPREIPAGLSFDCRVLSTIDSEAAAAGDPIDAALSTPIVDKSGKVLAPAGARIHGRLMGFTLHSSSAGRKESYEVEIQLRSLELGGELVPFAANVSNSTSPSRVHLNLHPRSGTFMFYDKKLHVTNIDAKWITAEPAPETKPAP